MNLPHCQFLSLIYHDLFDYPLTLDELKFWQIGTQISPRHKVAGLEQFFFLPGRGEIVSKRRQKSKFSEEKYVIAQAAARVLASIPTVLYVGVTGSLAMGNTKREDDIDLFIVTVANSLWSTRLLAHLTLSINGLQVRKYNDRETNNRLCLNLWLDDNSLKFDSRKEIYTAHEILQIKTLFDRAGVYKKVLLANKWVRKFFPEAFSARIARKVKGVEYPSGFLVNCLKILETPSRVAQLIHMSTKRTREIVDNTRAMFHPVAWNEYIPQVYLSRLEEISQRKTWEESIVSQIGD